MPLVRIDLRKGKDAAYRREVGRVVYDAMVGVGVPEKDRFQIIAEHDAGNFLFDPSYLGIERTDDLVIIQITWNEGRTVEQKKTLYKAIADGLAKSPAFGRRTSSSTSSRSRRRTGPSATASRNTRPEGTSRDVMALRSSQRQRPLSGALRGGDLANSSPFRSCRRFQIGEDGPFFSKPAVPYHSL